jgi:hypothetical protein
MLIIGRENMIMILETKIEISISVALIKVDGC